MGTLLEMGACQWKGLLKERIEVFEFLKKQLNQLGLEVYDIKRNNIQIAIKPPSRGFSEDLGAKLFHRNVTGCRLIKFDEKRVKFGFSSWGAHTSGNFETYL